MPGPPLLGVFEVEYQDQSRQLQTGDRLLLMSDGAYGGDVESAASPRLLESVERHRELPLQTFVDALARDLLEHARQPDDLTLLAVEML